MASIRPAIPAIELRTFFADGGGTTVFFPTPAAATSVAVAGNGPYWALTCREAMPDVNTWGSSNCGPACFMTVGVLYATPVTLRASFISADSAAADLAGGTFDVACARSLAPRSAVPTLAFGKLHVLYSDLVKNELYVCDLPSF